jgi:hypothetical protein
VDGGAPPSGAHHPVKHEACQCRNDSGKRIARRFPASLCCNSWQATDVSIVIVMKKAAKEAIL